MNSMLAVKNISAGYGSRIVVKNISIDIPMGKFCALLGLNGSGKTTLIKAILGLIPIKTGSCFINGTDCTHMSEYKRARYISYIPQRHSKLLGVSVIDAVMMGYYSALGPLEYPSDIQKQAALGSLQNVGLAHFADEDFSRLSEGQKQMVILARTLIQNTPIMLMDEPDGALDFLNRHYMLSEVRSLIHKNNIAGLVTLHDPGLALKYCDHLFLIANGKIRGDLDISDISGVEKNMVEDCLSLIYNDITVFDRNGKYFVEF